MNFLERLDPELKAAVNSLPPDRGLDLTNITAARPRRRASLMFGSVSTSPMIRRTPFPLCSGFTAADT